MDIFNNGLAFGKIKTMQLLEKKISESEVKNNFKIIHFFSFEVLVDEITQLHTFYRYIL